MASLEAEIAHDRGHKRVLSEPSLFHHLERADGHDRVTVNDCPLLVAQDDTVRVAVKGDADLGTVRYHGPGDDLGVERSATLVDVHPVRLVIERDDVRAELDKDARTDLVGGAVCRIHHDAQARKVHAARDGRFYELVVTADRIIDPEGLADLRGRRADGIDGAGEDQVLHLLFDLVRKLEPVAAEELDAVVLIGVVRGRDHDARIGPETPREECDARRGHRADEQHVHAHGAEPRR